jgi:hypothetical protein
MNLFFFYKQMFKIGFITNWIMTLQILSLFITGKYGILY